MPSDIAIIGMGEVLWDLLPTGKMLGGAPFNFVFHCHQLGQSAVMVSRVGKDALGAEIRSTMRSLGLRDEFVQEDPAYPTGTVGVEIDAGQPTFRINEGAWDHLAWDDRLSAMLASAQVVHFGSLIQRHPTARNTLDRLLRLSDHLLIVFDVNLRQVFYSKEVLERSLLSARWVKLNDGELRVLKEMFGLTGTSESSIAAQLRKAFRVELVAITRGANGCLVQTDDEEVVVTGVPVDIVDTIGAGDAFTAGLVVAVLEGKNIADSALFANRLAARVASAAGGTPRIDRREIDADREARPD
jgi:fructokinase